MSKKRKICFVTGSRADYGLLYHLMKKVKIDKKLELQIIVTGMHLSSKFGYTYREIEKDFKINKKIDLALSSDSSIGISKSMGLAQISFAEVYDDLKPDIVLVLGDRYEIFSAVSAAMIARIPIAHLHGGETTEGAFDEAIRHSITKMSHLHFTATNEYRKRVIQLGENPSKVFNVGATGIENIKKNNLLSKREFEISINRKLFSKNILITFHPVTLEENTAKHQFKELLKAIDELKNTFFIFTKANSDTGGRIINKMIDEYVDKNFEKSVLFTSLGQSKYLSALKHVDIVVGNSSSGIIEAPSFKTATLNIGDRQKGRIMADSILNCKPDSKSIKKSLKKIYSIKFQKILKNTKNPYDNGCSSQKILKILKNIKLNDILKKKFYQFSI